MKEYGYCWSDCENFDVPQNTIRCGSDDDGSVIYCGKAWCDGKEVPAKIIPNKRECRVRCDSGERVVHHCSKVLICNESQGIDECCKPKERHHHHHHGHHHHNGCDNNCCRPCDDYEEEEEITTTTESNNNNQCKTFVRACRVVSSNNTITVKKVKIRKERPQPRCHTEIRTRMVPKVTYDKKIRYVPQVHTEKNVRLVPETYETIVCDSCCESKSRCQDQCPEPCPELCKDPCQERCSEPCPEPCQDTFCCESVYCPEPTRCEEEVIVRPKKNRPQPSRKIY